MLALSFSIWSIVCAKRPVAPACAPAALVVFLLLGVMAIRQRKPSENPAHGSGHHTSKLADRTQGGLHHWGKLAKISSDSFYDADEDLDAFIGRQF